MNKLIPFTKLATGAMSHQKLLSNASVVINDSGVPLGFFFGRDSLISLMTVIDEQFERTATSARDRYNNVAGKIIDLIEERLPVNPKFARDLRASIRKAKKAGWIPLSQIRKTI